MRRLGLTHEQLTSDRLPLTAPAKSCEGATMGRGRAKAKQTKVARDLKYRTHETDFASLAQELHGDESNGASRPDSPEESDEYDKWSDYTGPRRD